MSRFCDALECTATTASGRFLCIAHWRMVPLATQQTINGRYRACCADFGYLSDEAYLQACIDAITGIATTERRELVPTSYHRLLRVARRRAAP